jgi:TolA-binding protein
MQRMYRRGALAAALALCLGFAATAQAQSTGSETERNVDQQQRSEQGLQSGQLDNREASRLEQGEARIDRSEQRDLANGSLSASEKAQIQREQGHESKAIYSQKHDAQTGNPDSNRSRLMQANVQRDVNQEQRIHEGVKNGSLTNRETSRMQGRQAHSDHMDARDGRNGYISPREEYRTQRTDNRDSRRIYRDKHNGRVRH